MEPSQDPADENSFGPLETSRVISRPRHSSSASARKHPRLQEIMKPPSLKLRFINSPPPMIFTSSRIEAEDGSPIAIELIDIATNTRDTLESLMSLRIEIVALDADVTEESLSTWEFNRNILRPRDEKRPLLFGDLTVTLKDGVGVISNIAFTDNSCWTRSGKFRLGAKATEGGVVEAISQAFACKDQRGESNQRHDHPYFDSEVWRLDKIPKHGVTESHLRQAGIHTVKDLRRYLAINSNTLPQFLKGKISEKSWKAIVSHSMHSVLDESERYVYNSEDHRASLLFNSVYEVMKVSFNGITFLNTTGLTPTQQDSLGKLKLEAYANVNSFVAADSVNFPSRSSSSMKDAELSTWVPKSQGTDSDSDSDEEFDYSVVSDEEPDSIDVYEPLGTFTSSSKPTHYDVVIRYIKGDISNDDFVSHLHAALCRRQLSVLEDFDEVDAVPKCSVLILFFTNTYVSSNLLSILEHQQTESRVVCPLFYRIRPSDLTTNSKNYERYFLQYEPKRWQAALKEITRMRGYILADKSETELIDEIVRDALKVSCSRDKEKMIGINTQVEEILSLLCIESPDVCSVGIWGMVGIGKTAIAEEIFRRISIEYESCVFMNDLNKKIEVKGHDAVREDFLCQVLEVKPHVIRFSDIKTSFLRSRLQSKKVLVILDNVNDFRDVETFLGKLNCFGPGSRIIITSRNRHVFVLCKIDHVYEVKPLDISKSLLLLEWGTSPSILSSRRNRSLSLELVKFSNGNPKVLQFLRKSVREWKQLLQQFQKTSPIYIEDIYERSCCGLDDNERSIFLDIACFFRRMDKDNVAMLLDGCGFSAHVGFRSLVDKSLLTISNNMVDMLRFIQATGREIVRQESADRPGDRSRLWNFEDIRDVFTDDTGTSVTQGIFLDMSKLKLDANPYVFEKMCNLRLLKIYCSEVTENRGVYLPQGLEYLPSKLRLLHWEYYPLSSLPQSFDPKNLVELNLPSSCAKKLWKGEKSLEKLKKMKLSYSNQLTKIPRLSSAPNLELLDLKGCNSLLSINHSISYLKKLVFLNLKDCSKLESIPSTVDLESLDVLNLSGCSKLEEFPEISPNVKELYLGGTMIKEIPSSIKNLVLLEKLDLENNRHLVNLPTSICKLKHLETLNLSGCTSLERFPELSRRMKCLRFLDLSRTAIKELHSSISYLTALEELKFVDCKNLIRLPDNAWSLRFKVEFRQIDREKFARLWNRFGWLKKVQIS